MLHVKELFMSRSVSEFYHMDLVEFKSIHKYVGAIYFNLACKMINVFVDSCKRNSIWPSST